METLTAALECRDRTCMIHIIDIGPETSVTVLHEQFPVLTHFLLFSTDDSMPVLPERFLGGSAPRLRSCSLKEFPFPSFPKFVLCSPDIVLLHLLEIPSSGYKSPEVMATCLAALPNLAWLSFGFRSPLSRLPIKSASPHTCSACSPPFSLQSALLWS